MFCTAEPLKYSRLRGSVDYVQLFRYFPVLRERAEQRAGTLSAGEQQMVAIARALISRPKLMLLDEPSAGLAPGKVRQLGEILLRLNATGVAMLIVEQNIDFAFELASYVYVCQGGRIAKSGRPSELKQEDIFQIYLR